jgi:hypothetical protein
MARVASLGTKQQNFLRSVLGQPKAIIVEILECMGNVWSFSFLSLEHVDSIKNDLHSTLIFFSQPRTQTRNYTFTLASGDCNKPEVAAERCQVHQGIVPHVVSFTFVPVTHYSI